MTELTEHQAFSSFCGTALISNLKHKLTPMQKRILEFNQQGVSVDEIGRRIKITPGGIRKTLNQLEFNGYKVKSE